MRVRQLVLRALWRIHDHFAGRVINKLIDKVQGF